MADASSTPTTIAGSNAWKDNQPLLLSCYVVGKLLDRGTFAKVHHARNVKSSEGVAIKTFDKEKILKRVLIAHMKHEISILRCRRHPNILQHLTSSSSST